MDGGREEMRYKSGLLRQSTATGGRLLEDRRRTLVIDAAAVAVVVALVMQIFIVAKTRTAERLTEKRTNYLSGGEQTYSRRTHSART